MVGSAWRRWPNQEHLLLREHRTPALLEEHVELSALAEVHDDVQRAALDERVAVPHDVRVVERGELLDLLLRLIVLLRLHA